MFPAWWTGSSCPECCSEQDWSAKFPESRASELFPASGKSEQFQVLCQEPALPFQALDSQFPELEKPFPVVLSQAELFPESVSILECWSPVR